VQATHLIGADGGMGSLPLVVEYLGVSDVEGLLDALRVIRTYRPPKPGEQPEDT
jgi:hypothetical protein